MAYGQQTNNAVKKFGTTAAQSKPAASSSSSSGKKEPLYRTGLFVPTREGVKTLASVKTKEDVMIPAGSYINIYKNDDKKTESSPDYTMTVTAGK